MPSLDDVYRKFGFAAEAAQLLETELGNGLFVAGAVDADLIDNPDPIKAREIWEFVNRQTLGQLLKSLNRGPLVFGAITYGSNCRCFQESMLITAVYSTTC